MADYGMLWTKLAELFGGKALEAKFGAVPPDVWRLEIGRMSEFELERGIRRLTVSGRAHIPTLPEFLRLCREIGSELDGAQQSDRPRYEPPLQPWEREASGHLLAYLFSRTKERNAQTTEPNLMQILVTAKNNWAEQMREWSSESAVPSDGGRSLWFDMMRGAETSIDLLTRAAARAP